MSGLVRKVVECFFDSSAAELGHRSLFGKPPSTWSAEPLCRRGCWVCSLCCSDSSSTIHDCCSSPLLPRFLWTLFAAGVPGLILFDRCNWATGFDNSSTYELVCGLWCRNIDRARAFLVFVSFKQATIEPNSGMYG